MAPFVYICSTQRRPTASNRVAVRPRHCGHGWQCPPFILIRAFSCPVPRVMETQHKELGLGKLDSHPQRTHAQRTHVKLRGINERTYYGLQTTAAKRRLLVSLVANLVLMSTRSITFFRNKCGRDDDGRGPLVGAKPCERQLGTVLVYDGLPNTAMFVFAHFAADGTN